MFRLPLMTTLAAVAMTAGCSSAAMDASAPSLDTTGSAGAVSGVGQGGAQDFGLFRQILEDGDIPGPETIDDVGFFNEHVIALPPPDCGAEVCLHGLYGTMGNMISGSDCTVVLLGMNTTLTPDTLERPPLNLTVVVDTSGSMGGTPIRAVREGLDAMLPELEPVDRVTVVSFDDDAEVVVEALAPDDPELAVAIGSLTSGGGTNIYDGLRLGYETAELWATPETQDRVMFLSDGMASVGITSPERILSLSSGYNATGLGLTTIGVGEDFDVELMRDLSEQGGGSFYFVEDPLALQEVFREEVDVFLVPIAEEAHISLSPGAPWDLRGVYGTRMFDIAPAGATIDIPILQLAGRTSPSDDAHGRRGGGGAMLVELLPTGAGPMVGQVGALDFSYRVPGTDEIVTQSVEVVAPEQSLDTDWFTDPSVEKGFVMLNLYMAFEMAAEDAAAGDDAAALAVLDAVEVNVDLWLEDNADADIADDLRYVRMFIDNLEARASDPESPERDEQAEEPWPHD